MDRIKAYSQTGVEAIRLAGLRTRDQLEAVHQATSLPLTVLNPPDRMMKDMAFLAANGVRILMAGNPSFGMAVQAVYDCFKHLKEGGAVEDLASREASPELLRRVSSDKQDVDLSISAQLRALIQFAEAQGHHVVRQFVDEVESGRSIHRAEFQEMISLAWRKPPPFQAILVWKLSRFARNREDSILYKSFLKKQGVTVISIN